MTALIDHYGKKDGVRFGEMPDPELRDDDVLVQVHVAGVNLLDSKIRKRKSSNSFLPYLCLIAYRSFWVMMWLGSWSEWDLECGGDSVGLPKDLVLYCARHGFGTEMYRATKNLFAVMNVMGHTAVSTTMKYQHQDIDEVGAVASHRVQ